MQEQEKQTSIEDEALKYLSNRLLSSALTLLRRHAVAVVTRVGIAAGLGVSLMRSISVWAGVVDAATRLGDVHCASIFARIPSENCQ